MRLAAVVRGALVLSVIDKSSRVTEQARLRWPDAKIISVLTGDMQRLSEAIRWFSLGPISFVATIAAFALLLIILGTSALLGIAIIIIGALGSLAVGKLVLKARVKATAQADVRAGLTHQFLRHLGAVKLHAWEAAVAGRVQEVRRNEIRRLRVRKGAYAPDYLADCQCSTLWTQRSEMACQYSRCPPRSRCGLAITTSTGRPSSLRSCSSGRA